MIDHPKLEKPGSIDNSLSSDMETLSRLTESVLDFMKRERILKLEDLVFYFIAITGSPSGLIPAILEEDYCGGEGHLVKSWFSFEDFKTEFIRRRSKMNKREYSDKCCGFFPQIRKRAKPDDAEHTEWPYMNVKGCETPVII